MSPLSLLVVLKTGAAIMEISMQTSKNENKSTIRPRYTTPWHLPQTQPPP